MNYLSKDQNWADETTIYWFEEECSGEIYDIADNNGFIKPLDCDGTPIEGDDYLVNKLLTECVITEEMRAE